MRRFHFSIMTTTISILSAIICYLMGYWQYTRWDEKKAYMAELASRQAEGRQPFDADADNWDHRLHGLTRAEGVFDFSKEMVLISQSKDNVYGVKLITPLTCDNGRIVLVDRGLLPYEFYANDGRGPFQPAGRQVVEGILRPSQTKAFFLAPTEHPAEPGAFKERFRRIDLAAMASNFEQGVLPVYIEQTNGSGEWPAHDPRAIVGPGRHLNYTIQWSSFGSFAIFLGIFLQFRGKRKNR